MKEIEITQEKFNEIYTNEKFRNEVAHAHGCLDKYGKFKYYSTCSYPQRYIVSEEQIKIAKELKEKARKETLEKNKNKLVFVGMGCTYTKEEINNDVGNYRIRTEFLNSKGEKFFIELGMDRYYKKIRCDYSINRDLEDKYNSDTNQQSKFYNCKGLERNNGLGEYTKSNILKLVNKYFDCNFKEVIIDNYNLSCDGVICESPKCALLQD